MVEEGWLKFIRLCAREHDIARLEHLFDFFLTHEERQSIATRLSLTKALLAEEMTQREMAERLHISIAKITRGSNELKRLTVAEKEQLKKWLEEEWFLVKDGRLDYEKNSNVHTARKHIVINGLQK